MFDDLIEAWKTVETTLRAYGAEQAADAVARCAADLAERYREWQLEALTLDEAAEYSGLAAGTIGNKVRAGEIPNAGTKGRPRVRRCDLQAKPPGSPDTGNPDEAIDLADRILARRLA